MVSLQWTVPTNFLFCLTYFLATLPNPRLVSNRMVEMTGKYTPNDLLINQLHLDWGHFITCDMLNTYVSTPLKIPGMYDKLPIRAYLLPESSSYNV